MKSFFALGLTFFSMAANAFDLIDFLPTDISGMQSPYFISPAARSSQPGAVTFEIGVKKMGQLLAQARPKEGAYSIDVIDLEQNKIVKSAQIDLPKTNTVQIQLPKGRYEARVKYLPGAQHRGAVYRDIDVVRFSVEAPAGR